MSVTYPVLRKDLLVPLLRNLSSVEQRVLSTKDHYARYEKAKNRTI